MLIFLPELTITHSKTNFWSEKNVVKTVKIDHFVWVIKQEYMADVEVRAAHNVLEACAQTETIDKVVFTSSATAVVWREDRKTIERDLDERHWSDVNFCRKFKVCK